MKKYLALSLLVMNVACADNEGWTEWGQKKTADVWHQAQGAWKNTQNAANAAWSKAVGSNDNSVPTAEETDKKAADAVRASYQTEQDFRQAMKHEITATEGKLHDDVVELMFLIEQCMQPESACEEQRLIELRAAMQKRMTEFTGKALAASDVMRKRHEQADAVENANAVVQQGERDGAVIGAGDEEKKKALDEKYFEAVRNCHRLGSKCDKKYLSQLRDEKNALEKAWLKQAVENNNRMIAARYIIDRAYPALMSRSDIDAFANKYGITIEKQEVVVEQPVLEIVQEEPIVVQQEEPVEESQEEQQADSVDTSIAADLVKLESEEQKEADAGEALS